MPRKPKFDLHSHLDRLLPVFQEHLRLQDWDINVHVISNPPDDEDALARVHWHSIYPRANIYFVHPGKWNWEVPPDIHDINKVLLHELLHLNICPINRAMDQYLRDLQPLRDAIEYSTEDFERLLYPLLLPILEQYKLCPKF